MTKTKEMKKFYSEDKLNKGYSNLSTNNLESKKTSDQFSDVLPPLEVIQEYEELYPGTLDKILKLAEQEQNQKYQIEQVNISARERGYRMGALAGIFSLIIISSASYKIATVNSQLSALFFVSAFIAVFAISFLSYIKNAPKTFNKNKKKENYDLKAKNSDKLQSNFKPKPSKKFKRKRF